MTQKEKELLLFLLKKANEEGCISIYDNDENFYSVSWIFSDGNDIIIKI